MDTAKPKGGKWQATLKIEEGSSKLMLYICYVFKISKHLV